MEGSTKHNVVEMMARRDRERKLAIEKTLKARQEKSEADGTDHFEVTFDKNVRDLENQIANIKTSEDAKSLQEEFNVILNSLRDLQNFFSSSIIFLSDHKIKTCQNAINQLQSKCEEKKTILLPKKKFGFKNKVQNKSEVKAEGVTEEIKESKTEFKWTESKKQKTLITYEGDNVNNKDLTFTEMEDCVIKIIGHAGSLQMSKMKNCLVLCGPVARSVFADNCENCTFVFACQQFRFHSSTSCDIYIHVTSRAIIEDCKNIRFAPSTYTYDEFNNDMKNAGLDCEVNNWNDVGDFNWLSTDKPSPNWSRIEEEEQTTSWDAFVDDYIEKHFIASF